MDWKSLCHMPKRGKMFDYRGTIFKRCLTTKMKNLNKIFITWYRANRQVLAENGFKSLDDVVDWCGWPSETGKLYANEPYFEELQHVINDDAEELGVPLPDEVIQYNLSNWMDTKIPIDHPLVQDREKWLKIYFDTEYDMASPADAKQLWMLVYNTAGPRLKENLGDYEEVLAYYDSPDITGKTYLAVIGGRPIRFVAGDDVVAFMDEEAQIKVFDYEGNRVHEDMDLPKVQNFLISSAKFSHSLTEPGELASILGNNLADMLMGEDGIGLLDLP